MAEQKAATPAKKRTTATAGATKAPAASKPKVAKTAAETPTKKPAAKKPVAKKAAAAAETKKVATAKAKPAVANKSKAQPTPEERYRMVETAAYFIAERHGFQGDSTGHWVAAEAEIAALLGK